MSLQVYSCEMMQVLPSNKHTVIVGKIVQVLEFNANLIQLLASVPIGCLGQSYPKMAWLHVHIHIYIYTYTYIYIYTYILYIWFTLLDFKDGLFRATNNGNAKVPGKAISHCGLPVCRHVRPRIKLGVRDRKRFLLHVNL